MLTAIQSNIVKIISVNRTECSYFAGGTVQNMKMPRRSDDLGIFHDDEKIAQKHFLTDIGILRQKGYSIEIIRTPVDDGIGEAIVSLDNYSTIIQWALDTIFRFFPVVKSDDLGFSLDYHDQAINMILAMAGRRKIRDYYDICKMISIGKPVEGYIWAACGKDSGYTPDFILDCMTRNSVFSQGEYKDIFLDDPEITSTQMKRMFNDMVFNARNLYTTAPAEELGCLFLRKDTGDIFFPSAEDFDQKNYICHWGQVF